MDSDNFDWFRDYPAMSEDFARLMQQEFIHKDLDGGDVSSLLNGAFRDKSATINMSGNGDTGTLSANVGGRNVSIGFGLHPRTNGGYELAFDQVPAGLTRAESDTLRNAINKVGERFGQPQIPVANFHEGRSPQGINLDQRELRAAHGALKQQRAEVAEVIGDLFKQHGLQGNAAIGSGAGTTGNDDHDFDTLLDKEFKAKGLNPNEVAQTLNQSFRNNSVTMNVSGTDGTGHLTARVGDGSATIGFRLSQGVNGGHVLAFDEVPQGLNRNGADALRGAINKVGESFGQPPVSAASFIEGRRPPNMKLDEDTLGEMLHEIKAGRAEMADTIDKVATEVAPKVNAARAMDNVQGRTDEATSALRTAHELVSSKAKLPDDVLAAKQVLDPYSNNNGNATFHALKPEDAPRVQAALDTLSGFTSDREAVANARANAALPPAPSKSPLMLAQDPAKKLEALREVAAKRTGWDPAECTMRQLGNGGWVLEKGHTGASFGRNELFGKDFNETIVRQEVERQAKLTQEPEGKAAEKPVSVADDHASKAGVGKQLQQPEASLPEPVESAPSPKPAVVQEQAPHTSSTQASSAAPAAEIPARVASPAPTAGTPIASPQAISTSAPPLAEPQPQHAAPVVSPAPTAGTQVQSSAPATLATEAPAPAKPAASLAETPVVSSQTTPTSTAPKQLPAGFDPVDMLKDVPPAMTQAQLGPIPPSLASTPKPLTTPNPFAAPTEPFPAGFDPVDMLKDVPPAMTQAQLGPIPPSLASTQNPIYLQDSRPAFTDAEVESLLSPSRSAGSSPTQSAVSPTPPASQPPVASVSSTAGTQVSSAAPATLATEAPAPAKPQPQTPASATSPAAASPPSQAPAQQSYSAAQAKFAASQPPAAAQQSYFEAVRQYEASLQQAAGGVGAPTSPTPPSAPAAQAQAVQGTPPQASQKPISGQSGHVVAFADFAPPAQAETSSPAAKTSPIANVNAGRAFGGVAGATLAVKDLIDRSSQNVDEPLEGNQKLAHDAGTVGAISGVTASAAGLGAMASEAAGAEAVASGLSAAQGVTSKLGTGAAVVAGAATVAHGLYAGNKEEIAAGSGGVGGALAGAQAGALAGAAVGGAVGSVVPFVGNGVGAAAGGVVGGLVGGAKGSELGTAMASTLINYDENRAKEVEKVKDYVEKNGMPDKEHPYYELAQTFKAVDDTKWSLSASEARSARATRDAAADKLMATETQAKSDMSPMQKAMMQAQAQGCTANKYECKDADRSTNKVASVGAGAPQQEQQLAMR